MTDSQNKLIKQHLKSGKTITALEALRLFGCFRLASRINDLKKEGVLISSRTITTLDGKRISEYYATQDIGINNE